MFGSLQELFSTYLAVWIISTLAWGLLWGFCVMAVVNNRGYYEESTKWFWLGFFFGIFALIVALTKPRVTEKQDAPLSEHEKKLLREKQLLDEGGWRCECGAVNARYVSTCSCGRRKPRAYGEQIDESQKSEAQKKAEKELLERGGWRCKCGEVNAFFVEKCACGRSREEAAAEDGKGEVPNNVEADDSDVEKLVQYKKLLDGGVITQEEFDIKKKQLLKL